MTVTVSPSSARRAVATIFLLHGSLWGAWVPHIPLVKARLEVGEGVFGLALLSLAAGAVIAMPLAGGLINRLGSAKMTILTGIAFCCAFLGPVLSPSLPMFFIAGFVYGACIGSMDVSMNAHGLVVERALRLPTMSLFHGMFSIGGMAGAFLGFASLQVMSSTSHALLSFAISLALLLAVIGYLLPSDLDRGLSGSHFAWPTAATIGLGLLCFLALMAEGSIVDWAALMLQQRFLTDAGTAALGFGFFSAGMAGSRLFGDGLRLRFGAVRLVGWSAAIAAVAMVAALAVPSLAISVVALGAVGLGVGNIAPVLFAGGGRLEPDAPGRGIAAVTTLGYSGFLAGPPLIGFAAEVVGLTMALGLTAAAATIIAMTARQVAPADTY